MKMILNLNLCRRFSVTLLFPSLFAITINAQSPLEFFPHQVGNLWQYRLSTGHLMWTEIIDTVYSDTTGIVYVGYTNINHDTWGTPSVSKGWYMIKDSIFIYKDQLPRIVQQPKLLYKLDATLNEKWVAEYMGDSTWRWIAQIYNEYQSIVYGKNVTIKEIKYGITYDPYVDTMWWDWRTLAEGFGMIWAQLEPMAPVYLTGAIINGVRYGYIVGVEESEYKPNEFVLHQNYPNPFNPSTVINYQLSVNGPVKLRVYDLLGREIALLVDEYQVAKTYSIKFDASTLPAGIYFYQLQTKGGVLTKKMTLIK